VLGLWQRHIERILAAWPDELGIPVLRGCDVVGFAQDDTGIDVEVSDGSVVRAQYLVGCDGGRSSVRRAGQHRLEERSGTARTSHAITTAPAGTSSCPGTEVGVALRVLHPPPARGCKRDRVGDREWASPGSSEGPSCPLPARLVSRRLGRSCGKEQTRLSLKARYFVVQYPCVFVHASARRHGVDDEDALHAVAHSLAVEDLGDDPDRWLVVGPDSAGNMLEVVVLLTEEGTELIIHAMPLRPIYRRLLER